LRTAELKIKFTSTSAEAIKAVTDDLLDRFEGYSSPLLASDTGGWHSFITLKAEVHR